MNLNMFLIAENGVSVFFGEGITVVTRDGVRHFGVLLNATPTDIVLRGHDRSAVHYPLEAIDLILPNKLQLEQEELEYEMITDLFFFGKPGSYKSITEAKKRAFQSVTRDFVKKYIAGYKMHMRLVVANNEGMGHLNIELSHTFKSFPKDRPEEWDYQFVNENNVEDLIEIRNRNKELVDRVYTTLEGDLIGIFILENEWIFQDEPMITSTEHEIEPILNDVGKQLFGNVQFLSNFDQRENREI